MNRARGIVRFVPYLIMQIIVCYLFAVISVCKYIFVILFTLVCNIVSRIQLNYICNVSYEKEEI